jgi:hypothetical protein
MPYLSTSTCILEETGDLVCAECGLWLWELGCPQESIVERAKRDKVGNCG